MSYQSKMYLLIFFIASVQANCTFPQAFILNCDAIETFPDIDRPQDIVYIDIQNSLLTELPLFVYDKWQSLEFLTFRNNQFLPCTEIQKQIQDHIFYIDYDCNSTVITETPDKTEKPTDLYKVLLCMIGFAILVVLVTAYLIKVNIFHTKGNNDCSFQSL